MLIIIAVRVASVETAVTLSLTKVLILSHVFLSTRCPFHQNFHFLQDSIKIHKLKDQQILRSVDIGISEYHPLE